MIQFELWLLYRGVKYCICHYLTFDQLEHGVDMLGLYMELLNGRIAVKFQSSFLGCGIFIEHCKALPKRDLLSCNRDIPYTWYKIKKVAD